jgi:hypothetical protein
MGTQEDIQDLIENRTRIVRSLLRQRESPSVRNTETTQNRTASIEDEEKRPKATPQSNQNSNN